MMIYNGLNRFGLLLYFSCQRTEKHRAASFQDDLAAPSEWEPEVMRDAGRTAKTCRSDCGLPHECGRMIALNLCPVANRDLEAAATDAPFRARDHWLWPIISMTALLVALVASADDLLHHMTP
ncbi:hypothetical protein [Gluconacetobacter johannae]|uniref:Uncharacterized protein n=1 Tax=Gluconacetobacter johannae TaxID=112140 RepID=A0A7W4P4P0_9PROT|nr:hypothetical protein [Gluconacetobacter johannae]MBB2175288.1 hypothetical protein [Gluconacetobacter johannae]